MFSQAQAQDLYSNTSSFSYGSYTFKPVAEVSDVSATVSFSTPSKVAADIKAERLSRAEARGVKTLTVSVGLHGREIISYSVFIYDGNADRKAADPVFAHVYDSGLIGSNPVYFTREGTVEDLLDTGDHELQEMTARWLVDHINKNLAYALAKMQRDAVTIAEFASSKAGEALQGTDVYAAAESKMNEPVKGLVL